MTFGSEKTNRMQLPEIFPALQDGMGIAAAIEEFLFQDFPAPESANNQLEHALRVIQRQQDRIQYLESLAIRDDLTGLLNRRGFMQALKRETLLARRDKKACGILIMIDLDGFKQINDMWGHAVGDAYLKTVATVLTNEARSTDFVGRLGGDEFAILLPCTSPRAGKRRVERMMENFENRVMHNREYAIPMRASFGWNSYGEKDSIEALCIATDLKLYANKAARKPQAAQKVSSGAL